MVCISKPSLSWGSFFILFLADLRFFRFVSIHERLMRFYNRNSLHLRNF